MTYHFAIIVDFFVDFICLGSSNLPKAINGVQNHNAIMQNHNVINKLEFDRLYSRYKGSENEFIVLI